MKHFTAIALCCLLSLSIQAATVTVPVTIDIPDSIPGPKGDKGDPGAPGVGTVGPAGPQGAPGKDAVVDINELAKAVAELLKIPPPPAPVDCVATAFVKTAETAWGACVNSVQSKSETWTRTVTTQPANGGAACPTPLVETRTVTQACTVTPPPTAGCTTTLSPGANLGTAMTAATAGSTICLNNGSFGGFTLSGVTKNPRVTVTAVNVGQATITGQITFTGNTNGFTLDGVNVGAITITGANTRDITVKRAVSTGKFYIDGVTTATPNLLIEDFTQKNLNVSQANPAGIALTFAGRSTPVVTIRRAYIDGGCADGIQSGVPFILEDSYIANKQVGSCPNDPHTDAVQFYGGPFKGSIIRGNYFYRNVQVLAAYDGVDNVLVENNIFDAGPDGERRPCQIEWYSDTNSIIRHNTVLYRGSGYGLICIDRKSQDDAGVGTVVVDNIANSISINSGSSAAQNARNLVRSGSGSNVTGVPIFVGGAIPTTRAGFALAADSPGKGAASDGTDVGAAIAQ